MISARRLGNQGQHGCGRFDGSLVELLGQALQAGGWNDQLCGHVALDLSRGQGVRGGKNHSPQTHSNIFYVIDCGSRDVDDGDGFDRLVGGHWDSPFVNSYHALTYYRLISLKPIDISFQCLGTNIEATQIPRSAIQPAVASS